MPVTISVDRPTTRQAKENGRTVTEHAAGVHLIPTRTITKSQLAQSTGKLSGSTLTPYQELLAMGADPSDIASFRDMGSSSGP